MPVTHISSFSGGTNFSATHNETGVACGSGANRVAYVLLGRINDSTPVPATCSVGSDSMTARGAGPFTDSIGRQWRLFSGALTVTGTQTVAGAWSTGDGFALMSGVILQVPDGAAHIADLVLGFGVSSATMELTVAAGGAGDAVLLGYQNDGVLVTPSAGTTPFPPQDGVNGTPAPIYFQALTEAISGAGNVVIGGTTATSAEWRAAAFRIPAASGPDITDPTLTGAITPGASTSASISYSWPAGSDNVGVTGYERSLDGGTTWLNIGNVLTRTDTGLSPSTAYAVRVRALDAAGNDSTPPLAASISTTAAGDAIVPTLTGVITQGAVTETTIAYSWPAGADNVGVTAYERSLDGGATWLAIGNVLTRTDTGLTPSTAFPVRVRALDAAGNQSTPPLALSISTTAAPTFSAQIGPYAVAGIAATNVTVHYTLSMGDGPGGFTQVKQGSVLLNGSGVGTVTHTAAGRGYLFYSPVAPAVVDADKHMSIQPITLA